VDAANGPDFDPDAAARSFRAEEEARWKNPPVLKTTHCFDMRDSQPLHVAQVAVVLSARAVWANHAQVSTLVPAVPCMQSTHVGDSRTMQVHHHAGKMHLSSLRDSARQVHVSHTWVEHLEINPGSPGVPGPFSCLGLAGPAPELGLVKCWWASWSRTRRHPAPGTMVGGVGAVFSHLL
jgi:hypothetical protein